MRVGGRPPGAEPWFLRPFFRHQRQKYGQVLEAARVWARSPRLFLGVAFLQGAIDRGSSPIPAALRSLISVRVSQMNHCRFCVDLNSATLIRRHVAEDKVTELPTWRDGTLFDARERAALDYAEAVTRGEEKALDGQVDALRAFFDDDAIVELTALIAFQNMSSKFNAALGVPPQGFCHLSQPAPRDGPLLTG